MTHKTNLHDAMPFLNLLSVLRNHHDDEEEEEELSGMAASAYESITREWDRKVARTALDQLLEDASARIPKGARILNAGCGTGLRIPEIRAAFQPDSITGLDKSTAMLDRARENKFGAFLTTGDLFNLPFENETFDAVVVTWAMETLADSKRAVEECLRVLKSGGILAYCFVNLPVQFKLGDLLQPSVLRALEEVTREQELLGSKRIAFDDSQFALIKRHHQGLISTIILGKCCKVEPHMLPIKHL
jgi:ubiquinone/menaquinone biosynthesis C-methylase UbiE